MNRMAVKKVPFRLPVVAEKVGSAWSADWCVEDADGWSFADGLYKRQAIYLRDLLNKQKK